MRNDEVYLMLGRLEGKVDLLLQTRIEAAAGIKALDHRIGILERSKAWALGAAAAVAAIISGGFQILKG